MSRGKLLGSLLLLSVGLFACKSKKGESKPQPAEAAKPAAAATEATKPLAADAPKPVAGRTAVPEAKLAAGETLAELGDGVKQQTNPLVWTIAGQPAALAVIVKDAHALLRAYVGDKQVELAGPIDASGDMVYFLTPSQDGAAVHFRARTLAGHVAGVGALFDFQDFQITWDAAANLPALAQKWHCDETTAKGGECNGPDWTNDGQSAAPAPDPADDKEVADGKCCCEATFADPKTGADRLDHDIMSVTACTRKTDDGKCVDIKLCKGKK